MVAEVELLHLLLQEREVEHVGGFGDVARGAIVVEYLDVVVEGGVHVLLVCGGADQVGDLLLADAEGAADALGDIALVGGAEGLGGDLYLEQTTVHKTSAEGGEHLVGMGRPGLEAAPDVIVVELGEDVETLWVAEEDLTRDVLVDEVAECRGGIELHALAGQLLGTGEGVDEHLLAHDGGLVQIDLPVHEAAGGEEVLDGVDSLGLYHEVVVLDTEHLDDACRADVAFGDTGVEAVATQVVETVHIELAAHELVQEAFLILVLIDAYGKVEAATELIIDLLHEHKRYLLVVYTRGDGILQHMGEGSVTDVVHEDGQLHRLGFVVGNLYALASQRLYGLGHEEEGSERVLEAGVLRTGIDHRRQPQLLDALEALHRRMRDHLHDQAFGDVDEPEDGVVDDFASLHDSLYFQRSDDVAHG